MSIKNPKNISASVRHRLFNRSVKDQRPFTELLQYYAMERFLYRLSQSPHATRFVLKGALMLKVWDSPIPRPTMDIDMLGITSNEEKMIITQILEILAMDVVADGLIFDPDSIQTAKILEDADYEGIKIIFQVKLDTAKIKVQMDIGFGDIVYPRPEKAILLTLLDFPAPNIFCYSRESVIAEKFDAMVARGITNSRVKDFFDVWLLSRQFSFEKQKLTDAIRLTLTQRKTKLPDEIVAFSEEFITSRQPQWTAFIKRLQLEHVPESFQEIVASVKAFLEPIASAISSEAPMLGKWDVAGAWEQA